MSDPRAQFKHAVSTDDLASVREALAHPEVVAELDSGIFPYGRPALLEAQGTAMVDVLLEAGATIDVIGEKWASGFWVHEVPEAVSRHLLRHGAELTIHAAAALGLGDEVIHLLDADPALLEAPGGDGGTPLHFARTLDIVRELVARGAALDPRDEDHDSTPAQWHVHRAPEITRFLLENGAQPDVFLAAALGDLALTRQAIEEDPGCVTWRIGNNGGPFPGIGFEGKGGTMLQWQIGFNLAPQEVAYQRGFMDVYDLLMQHTPPKQQLQVACMTAQRTLAMEILAAHPDLVSTFDEHDRQLLGKACWETNNDTEAIRLMVDCGFPLGIPETNHGYTPLHNAAWCGNVEVVRLLIAAGHPVDLIDPQYQASAAGYAIHSVTEARKYEGDAYDYPGVIDALVEAGWTDVLDQYPVGHPGIDAVLEQHRDAGKA